MPELFFLIAAVHIGVNLIVVLPELRRLRSRMNKLEEQSEENNSSLERWEKQLTQVQLRLDTTFF